MSKYKVEYWFYDRDEISDYENIHVLADNEEEALFKAKHMARRNARNFKIV